MHSSKNRLEIAFFSFLCIDVSVLYISLLRSNSSSLRCYERTLAVININFISSFCAFFPSCFNIFLTGHLLLLVRSFLIRAGFDLYHHSDLDLCNFYGPSVRISARYKTPNPLCSSSLLLPFFIFSRSLCFFSPQKNITPETRSFTHHFTRSSGGFQIKL